MSPCISKSPRKQAANAAEEAKPKPLSPFERNKADELLDADFFPDAYRSDEIRAQVLIKAGWRKE
jgi:hypothetical protein